MQALPNDVKERILLRAGRGMGRDTNPLSPWLLVYALWQQVSKGAGHIVV